MAGLPIIELFHSPQGEGTRVGEPATFIRLAGCNLRCTWCDTPYSWNEEGIAQATSTTAADIAGQVRETSVVITGGEPMLHRRRLPDLISELRDHGVDHITVETNATHVPDGWWQAVDLWSLSPKLPASGEVADVETVQAFLDHAADRMQLKFVIADIARDWQPMWQLLEATGFSGQCEIIVQPDGLRDDYDVALRELSEHVMADDGALDGRPRRRHVRVVPQTHRIAWGARAVGV